eukprot:GHVR01096155.1.p1 GENE.GHVR01096155.1~~GHVR01096155.1.p1  ORF type:complete len:646 (-),score=115.00 GHVR01096155.1:582-2519(-)
MYYMEPVHYQFSKVNTISHSPTEDISSVSHSQTQRRVSGMNDVLTQLLGAHDTSQINNQSHLNISHQYKSQIQQAISTPSTPPTPDVPPLPVQLTKPVRPYIPLLSLKPDVPPLPPTPDLPSPLTEVPPPPQQQQKSSAARSSMAHTQHSRIMGEVGIQTQPQVEPPRNLSIECEYGSKGVRHSTLRSPSRAPSLTPQKKREIDPLLTPNLNHDQQHHSDAHTHTHTHTHAYPQAQLRKTQSPHPHEYIVHPYSSSPVPVVRERKESSVSGDSQMSKRRGAHRVDSSVCTDTTHKFAHTSPAFYGNFPIRNSPSHSPPLPRRKTQTHTPILICPSLTTNNGRESHTLPYTKTPTKPQVQTKTQVHTKTPQNIKPYTKINTEACTSSGNQKTAPVTVVPPPVVVSPSNTRVEQRESFVSITHQNMQPATSSGATQASPTVLNDVATPKMHTNSPTQGHTQIHLRLSRQPQSPQINSTQSQPKQDCKVHPHSHSHTKELSNSTSNMSIQDTNQPYQSHVNVDTHTHTHTHTHTRSPSIHLNRASSQQLQQYIINPHKNTQQQCFQPLKRHYHPYTYVLNKQIPPQSHQSTLYKNQFQLQQYPQPHLPQYPPVQPLHHHYPTLPNLPLHPYLHTPFINHNFNSRRNPK